MKINVFYSNVFDLTIDQVVKNYRYWKLSNIRTILQRSFCYNIKLINAKINNFLLAQPQIFNCHIKKQTRCSIFKIIYALRKICLLRNNYSASYIQSGKHLFLYTNKEGTKMKHINVEWLWKISKFYHSTVLVCLKIIVRYKWKQNT